MAEPKPEEISHPPIDQLQGLEYCIDSNLSSGGEAIALRFQHYILALRTAVMIPSFLVPLMGGTDASDQPFSIGAEEIDKMIAERVKGLQANVQVQL